MGTIYFHTHLEGFHTIYLCRTYSVTLKTSWLYKYTTKNDRFGIGYCQQESHIGGLVVVVVMVLEQSVFLRT